MTHADLTQADHDLLVRIAREQAFKAVSAAIGAELVKRGQDADIHALTLIRCLDYDRSLILDPEAYRAAVRTILDAMERAREQRLANMKAALVSIDSDEWDEHASPVPMPGTIG